MMIPRYDGDDDKNGMNMIDDEVMMMMMKTS